MSKTVIIWDWDNTLADTTKAVTAGLEEVVGHFNLPSLTMTDIKNVMMVHRGDFWQRSFKDELMTGINYYVQVYPKYAHLVTLFDGTIEVLQFIKNNQIPQIILSNKAHNNLAKEVKEMGVENYFTRIVGSDEIHGGKPELIFAQYALQGIEHDKVVLIGDGVSDMLMAQALGATSICVGNDLPKGISYDYKVQNIQDVLPILKGILNNE